MDNVYYQFFLDWCDACILKIAKIILTFSANYAIAFQMEPEERPILRKFKTDRSKHQIMRSRDGAFVALEKRWFQDLMDENDTDWKKVDPGKKLIVLQLLKDKKGTYRESAAYIYITAGELKPYRYRRKNKLRLG